MKLARAIWLVSAMLAMVLAGADDARAFGCIVNATPVAFGNYRSLHAADLVSIGIISYSCTGVRGPITIALSGGISNASRDRSMQQGAQLLRYGLYLDPTGTSVWGDGTNGSQIYVARGAVDGATVRLPVYGKVPPRQDVTHGDYLDTITVSLHF